MQEQGREGLTMPLLEMGSAKERELLQKVRDIYCRKMPRHKMPSAPIGPAQNLTQNAYVCARDLSDMNDNVKTDLRQSQGWKCAHGPQIEDANCSGPYQVMQNPYFVLHMPNTSTILYEREQGDMEEGLRVEGVQCGSKGDVAREEQNH